MRRKSDVVKDKKCLAKVCLENNILKDYFKKGLGALKGADKGYVDVPDTSLLSGSVALDEAAKPQYPLSNRWDYAIEYDGYTFFLEIHPASTSEIDCIINKVKFVKEWLQGVCKDFLSLPNKDTGRRCFYWISSGGTDLRVTPGSRQAKKLALYNIKPVGQRWKYSKLFKD